MFKGDYADTCTGKVEGLACADPGARTPIGLRGNFVAVNSNKYVYSGSVYTYFEEIVQLL